jgi:hypothetical protein
VSQYEGRQLNGLLQRRHLQWCPPTALDGDIVVAAIVVKPNAELRGDAACRSVSGLETWTSSSLTGSDIFAAGDCAKLSLVTEEKTDSTVYGPSPPAGQWRTRSRHR